MKTLYITDLDGTFLNDDARVSPRSAEIISQLSHDGVLISVATARTPATIEPILHDTYTTADMVVMTGAAIWNRPSHSYAHLQLVGERNVAPVLDTLSRFGVVPFCYVMRPTGHIDVYHATEQLNAGERVFVELRRNLSLKTFHLGEPLAAANHASTALFFALGSREAIVGAAEALRPHTDCYVSYYKDTYMPDLWLLEIFGRGVSKAAGVERLRRHIGADRVVAFGDNLNDIPMLKAADVAVAVGNALEETKAVADVIIGTNNEDAVANFIAADSRKFAG